MLYTRKAVLLHALLCKIYIVAQCLANRTCKTLVCVYLPHSIVPHVHLLVTLAVVAALKLIDDAPTDAWSLTRLAERTHIEPTYFVRLFSAVVGLSPMAYVTRRRLELATNLLRRHDLTVGEVGAMSGWVDANYFSRSFRKHFGMTPSRYRARFTEGPKRPRRAGRSATAAASGELIRQD